MSFEKLQKAKAAYITHWVTKSQYRIVYVVKNKTSVLLVDDEEANLNQLSLYLSMHGVYLCRNEDELLSFTTEVVIV